MLQRIEWVSNVGLFRDYKHSFKCELGEVTVIYGENGVGKTTLAAILDSLRERNASEIIRRRSLPGNAPPTVAISMNDKVYTFKGIDWDDQLPHDTLEVFYSGFVLRNVHAASSVDSEQRRNLCEYVLGRKAIENLKRLAEADDEARKALQVKDEAERQLGLVIKKPDKLETFLALPNDPTVDEQLRIARADITQAQSKEAIIARVVPTQVAVSGIECSKIAEILERSSEGIGANVAGVVREHIRQHLDNEGENWLAYGARNLRDDLLCPFCGQDVTNSSLARAIRSYFSDEYRTYTESLAADIKRMRMRSSPAAYSEARAAISGQIALASQWTDDMVILQDAVKTSLDKAETSWKRGAKMLDELIVAKQSQPLDRMDSALANEALTEYQHATDILASVNEVLLASAKKAEERKAALSNADVASIRDRISRLENQKMRFEPLAEGLIATRNDQIQRRSKLTEEKTVLKKAIDEHAARVLGKYQEGINYYLRHFGCEMQIESVEPTFPSGKASVQYALRAFGQNIPLGVSDDRPSFETVLSEGDKAALALSFFFARLKGHTDLTGWTVVLDDPVNSLGSSRRRIIEGVISDLRKRGAQVIVLTHDDTLAALIWRDRGLNPKDIVTLQVERTGANSHLVPWNIERAMQSQYVRDYLTLYDYIIQGGDHSHASARIRPYVEQRLRHLYPGSPLDSRDTLGIMLGKIRKSSMGDRLYPLQCKLTDLDYINAVSLPTEHATDDAKHLPPPDATEVRISVQKALDI
jgi:wobble nucleotide-excising tRNase